LNFKIGKAWLTVDGGTELLEHFIEITFNGDAPQGDFPECVDEAGRLRHDLLFLAHGGKNLDYKDVLRRTNEFEVLLGSLSDALSLGDSVWLQEWAARFARWAELAGAMQRPVLSVWRQRAAVGTPPERATPSTAAPKRH
jgi:hypothetical protein